jgi:uncharacterized protein (DUF3820 family)
VRLPFGKHVGREVSEVPTSYLEWFLANCQVGCGLRQEIEDVVESRRLCRCMAPLDPREGEGKR